MATASLDTAPVGEVDMCQDLGPDKLYSTLRSQIDDQSSICAFWLWPSGSDH
jgi:hypothetical protein